MGNLLNGEKEKASFNIRGLEKRNITNCSHENRNDNEFMNTNDRMKFN